MTDSIWRHRHTLERVGQSIYGASKKNKMFFLVFSKQRVGLEPKQNSDSRYTKIDNMESAKKSF